MALVTGRQLGAVRMEFPVGVFTPLTFFLKTPFYISIPVYYKLQKCALEPFYIRFTFMYAYIYMFIRPYELRT